MLLKDFREPLLSFELMHFRNSFCYRIENNRSFKYRILSGVGPLGINHIFFVSPGIAEILTFPKLSIHFEIVVYSKEMVKCGFWRKLPLLPLLWHANAVDEN